VNEKKEKEFAAVKVLFDSFPSVEWMRSDPVSLDSLPDRALSLLHWIVCPKGRKFQLERLDLPLEAGVDRLTYQFKVSYTSEEETASFAERIKTYGSLTGYHGSTTENFHGILRYGLKNWSGTRLMRNGALYGEGIYLASTLGIALSFSKPSKAWAKTALGDPSKLQVVVVCTIAANAPGVHLGTRSSNESELPKQYIVVANPDMLRIEGLMVWAPKRAGRGSFFLLFVFAYALLIFVFIPLVKNFR